jgi:hypothetical protein
MHMNKNFTHNEGLLTVARETLSCNGRRFGPFGTRISVRPGSRSRVVHRVLRKNEQAGFFRAITNA